MKFSISGIFHKSVTEWVTDRQTDRPTNRQTDRPTNRRTDTPSYRDARTHLKRWVLITLTGRLIKGAVTLLTCRLVCSVCPRIEIVQFYPLAASLWKGSGSVRHLPPFWSITVDFTIRIKMIKIRNCRIRNLAIWRLSGKVRQREAAFLSSSKSSSSSISRSCDGRLITGFSCRREPSLSLAPIEERKIETLGTLRL